MRTGKTKVFFDGSCPLCRREIAFYRRQRGADGFEWIDLAMQAGGEVTEGLSCSVALQRFHVQVPEGDILNGIDAFACLWQGLPQFRWLGWLCARPPARQIGAVVYELFLPVRPHLQRMMFPAKAQGPAA